MARIKSLWVSCCWQRFWSRVGLTSFSSKRECHQVLNVRIKTTTNKLDHSRIIWYSYSLTQRDLVLSIQVTWHASTSKQLALSLNMDADRLFTNTSKAKLIYHRIWVSFGLVSVPHFSSCCLVVWLTTFQLIQKSRRRKYVTETKSRRGRLQGIIWHCNLRCPQFLEMIRYAWD